MGCNQERYPGEEEEQHPGVVGTRKRDLDNTGDHIKCYLTGVRIDQ
jgi:hypothetical protein